MNFPSIRLEGAILTADLLDAIAREDKHSQKPADFGLNPSTKVKDEIASTWASAKALWTGYQAKIAALREGQTGVSETRNLFVLPMLALLGYQPDKAEAETLNGKSYAISHRDTSRDGFPLHIMGWHDSLEKKRSSGGPRISSHALVQEYLNLTEHLYGLVTNGRQLRLLRDSSRLIKLSFLEFDLIRIFEEDLYADFAILFRLIHATRMPANRANASGSVIEKYHQESVDSGSRIRDGLAAAVAYSMQTVANGLLAHPANASFVDRLGKEPGRADELHQNLLRWVYRTLFVLVIEERVLHHAPAATLRQRQIYRDYYSLQRLRRLADRPQLADRRSHDLWRAMHQTLRLYEDGGKGVPLGIAPLGSFLFREEGLQHLFQYHLDNRSLLKALNRLSTFTHPDTNVRMRVNYGALDVEEFGSVYESLLELRPRIIPEGDKLSFSYAQLAGNERKTSGSYYTPDSLVQCLLDSALDPIIEERLTGKRGQEAEKALLTIRVCDPAVGSGHFLIGAAHRLAHRLAEIRAGEEALSPDVQRHAMRDVVSHCLYGVDINPLSVELCKVSLWMLGMEPGKPLGFLDHHIRCGNSLLGTTPELVAKGIPDDAFKPITGDDSTACAELKKKNKTERKGLGVLFAKEDAAAQENLRKAVSAIDDIGDDSPEAIRFKEDAFKNTQQNYDFQKARDLANLWCAAFVIKKSFPGGASLPVGLESATPNPQQSTVQSGLFGDTEEAPKTKTKKNKAPRLASLEVPIGITTQHLRNFVEGGVLPDGLLAETKRLADRYQFFHFHLAFPEVFAQDGFDVCLGNPPWERVKLQEREWFAASHPHIAEAQTASIRATMIEELNKTEPAVFEAFKEAIRQAQAESAFVTHSGRFPLGAVGDTNTYPLFIETGMKIISGPGRVGLIVKTGILADYSFREFFKHLVLEGRFVSGFDFSNRRLIFPAVVANERFTLLTLAGAGSERFRVSILNEEVADLQQPENVWELTREDIALVNPNTLTCPLYQTASDAKLVSCIYRRVPILMKDSAPTGGNPLGALYVRMFDMSLDSGFFRDLEYLQSHSQHVPAARWSTSEGGFLSLLEGKLYDLFDHRHGTFAGIPRSARFGIKAEPNHPNTQEKLNPAYECLPRYWVAEDEVRSRYVERLGFEPGGVLSFRDVCRTHTDFRTVRAAICPTLAAGNKAPLLLFPGMSRHEHARRSALLCANLDAFALDYVARQKFAGGSLNKFILVQLPFLPPTTYEATCQWSASAQTFQDWLVPRVLELTYTARDLESFARDCGWSGPPFRWDEERRFLLRCELDAAYFHLYLGPDTEWRQQPGTLTQAFPTPRSAVSYILDTFPIVKERDETKYGDYRTKLVILKLYDELAAAATSRTPYQSKLNPPPADPAVAHPSRGPA